MTCKLDKRVEEDEQVPEIRNSMNKSQREEEAQRPQESVVSSTCMELMEGGEAWGNRKRRSREGISASLHPGCWEVGSHEAEKELSNLRQ